MLYPGMTARIQYTKFAIKSLFQKHAIESSLVFIASDFLIFVGKLQWILEKFALLRFILFNDML